MSHPDNSIAREPTVRLAAVGDLLLATGPGNRSSREELEQAFADVRPALGECDIVFGNLECCLPGDGATVPTEPRVITTPDLASAVGAMGFDVVSLANNHMFDCLEAGFLRMRSLLDGMRVAYFGAGQDLEEACRPAVLERNGLRIAFLGAVTAQTGPSRLAGPNQAGVALLDSACLAESIRRLRPQVDHVIVSPHWGEERFLIPSPTQVAQARAWVDAGATMVLGHHPHVLQGLEMHRGCPIIYSLGNFLAAEVHYESGDVLRWNRTERTGCVLLADLHRGGMANVRQVPTFDDGRAVRIDRGGSGRQLISRANRAVARGVTLRRYRREHLWVKTIRPILSHLRWSGLKALRWSKVRKAVLSIFQARRAE
jgi:poly-gamma-glutamate synthesis protein (capsule biosynthesis protein)